MSNLIFVTGNKGGIGKSTLARGLIDRYLAQNIPLSVYDGDTEIGSLHRFCHKVTPVHRIDMHGSNPLDKLMIDLDTSQPSPVVVDLAAGIGTVFSIATAELGFFDWLRTTRYQVSMFSVISNLIDSVVILKKLLESLEQQKVSSIHHVVVKNLHFGDPESFDTYDRSSTRKILLELGGKEIFLPKLNDLTCQTVDFKNLSFSQAVTDTSIGLPHRLRISTWLSNLNAELDQVSALVDPTVVDASNAA
ncbi:hypothetical protein [Merismopedia glauca]|uniref:CobQ/CobB/MinD/ParA nucleotide binding domain-containing protein n=1 Tax=Merismopedia glauca CCAP 1448/3 TaxID=1296344 RepID=A0A2T1C3E4_9CYAN|nr:hypothetical protein [Merismopedia glauca]PSB02790.1 hypothetical protein C7B64_11600 [Merismopedia glauca CCAP 1448/3]